MEQEGVIRKLQDLQILQLKIGIKGGMIMKKWEHPQLYVLEVTQTQSDLMTPIFNATPTISSDPTFDIDPGFSVDPVFDETPSVTTGPAIGLGPSTDGAESTGGGGFFDISWLS